jgi:hypothetical protein
VSPFYKHLFLDNSPHGDFIELGILDNHDVHLACILISLLLLGISLAPFYKRSLAREYYEYFSGMMFNNFHIH